MTIAENVAGYVVALFTRAWIEILRHADYA